MHPVVADMPRPLSVAWDVTSPSTASLGSTLRPLRTGSSYSSAGMDSVRGCPWMTAADRCLSHVAARRTRTTRLEIWRRWPPARPQSEALPQGEALPRQALAGWQGAGGPRQLDRWGSNPAPRCPGLPGPGSVCAVTWDSRMPAVTARAHRGPAVSDAVRTQRGPVPPHPDQAWAVDSGYAPDRLGGRSPGTESPWEGARPRGWGRSARRASHASRSQRSLAGGHHAPREVLHVSGRQQGNHPHVC